VVMSVPPCGFPLLNTSTLVTPERVPPSTQACQSLLSAQQAMRCYAAGSNMVLERSELIDSLQNEVGLLLHLCGKVKPEMLDYRPTVKQRSLIELLRYMTVQMPLLAPSIKGGEFLSNEWTAAEARGASMDFDALVKTLESQAALYGELVGGMSDDELRGEVDMFGMN
jgi:hypothetical protein